MDKGMDNMMDLITGESSEKETCCVLFVFFGFFFEPMFPEVRTPEAARCDQDGE